MTRLPQSSTLIHTNPQSIHSRKSLPSLPPPHSPLGVWGVVVEREGRLTWGEINHSLSTVRGA